MCLVNSVDERDLSLEGHRVSNAWKSRMHTAGAAAIHIDPSQCHQPSVRSQSSPPVGHFFSCLPEFDDTASSVLCSQFRTTEDAKADNHCRGRSDTALL